MFDDAFQAGIDASLADLARRPNAPKPQAPRFSLWALPGAAGRGGLAGVAEVGGSAADVTGAFGDFNLATDVPEGASVLADAGGGLGAPRAARDAAERRILDGEVFRTEVGRSLRNAGAGYMPDPVTSHAAELAVAEFSRIATKAVGAGVALGPVGGAVASGLEEGFTASDKLAEEGVELGTRSAVGAVTAAVQGVTFALPVAGKTAGRTVALALGGGTGGFVAQQLATREILQAADYSRLADQYDPFDPVGLALSTLLPLGFGAVAMRSAARARAGAVGREASNVGPKPEVAPVVPDEPPSARTPVANAVDEATADAARVNLLREQGQASRLSDTPAGRAADDAAVRKAAEQMAAGEPVNVLDVAQVEARALVRAWDSVRGEPLGSPSDPLVRLMPEDFGPVNVERGPVELGAEGLTVRAGNYGMVKFIWKHGPESPKSPEAQITRDDLAALPQLMRELEPDVRRVGGVDQLTWVSDRADGRRVVYGTTRFVQDGEHHLVTVHVDKERVTPPSLKREMPPELFGREALQASRAGTAAESFVSSSAESVQGQGSTLSPPPQRGGAADPARAAGEAPEIDRAATALEASNPDLPVRLDGMDEAVPLSELMERLRAEVADDLAEVPLVEVAAQCAIRSAQ